MSKAIVVDDNDMNLYMLEALLRQNGYEVWSAKDGSAAYQCALQNSPDIIISDILMPGTDGFALCRQCKQDSRLKHVPFVFYTATYTAAEDEKFAMSLGADLFVIKPTDPEVFLKMIAEALAKHRVGELTPHSVTEIAEPDYLKEYNATLFRKLEEKMRQLEESNRALYSSEKRFRQLAENAKDVIYRISLPDGRFEYINPAAAEITGYSQQEFYGSSHLLESIIHPDFSDDFRQKCSDILAGNPPSYSEFQIITRSGDIRWIHQRSVLLKDDRETPIALEGIATDVTESKLAEQEKLRLESMLRQSQKMEALGTLAGGIAHDFNNILFSIMGYAELSMDEVRKETKLYDYLYNILLAAGRASDLVRHILSFTHQSKIELKPVRLRTVASEAVNLLRASLPSNITIRQNFQSDANILADISGIRQIIINLCSNAAYSMRENGGDLSIGLEDVRLIPSDRIGQYPNPTTDSTEVSGHYLKLSVADTGIGMSPEVMEKIFDPYFTTKDKGRGTGLGLSVVQGIVRNFNGEIAVKSHPGKGSVFTIYFPVLDKQEAVIPPSNTDIPHGGHERILFVDDEDSIARMCRQMLEKINYRITVCTDSVEALENFRAAPDQFDLVITDMTMPKICGDRLTQELRAIRPDIPIIMCSGYSERLSSEKIHKLGIDAFLMKPVGRQELTQTIRKVLDAIPKNSR